MFSGTQPLALELGLDAPLACVDGSHMAASVSGKDLSCAALAIEELRILFEVLAEHEATPFAFSSQSMFHDDDGDRYLDYARNWSRRTELVKGLLGRPDWGAQQEIPAVLALAGEERIRMAEEALRARAPDGLQSVTFESLSMVDEHGRRPWALLVRAAGFDKGTAIAWLARHYGVELDEVVTLGDWINDIPMLERAGMSFAMAQAPEEVRASADYVLDADDERGGAIHEAAERAGLL
jgi:hydroxymethylpyrimidine pyrophosphatase-like HAD family hydrolase